MKDFLATGKVTLHLCDVAAMPVAVSSVDKVFHCNCYYFWPDQKKAALEIHRVMKPGNFTADTLFCFYSCMHLSSKVNSILFE